jgi:hypothetical protein
MVAIKTRFDGHRIETPPELRGPRPTDILIVVDESKLAPSPVAHTAWDAIGQAPRPRTQHDIETQVRGDRDTWDR